MTKTIDDQRKEKIRDLQSPDLYVNISKVLGFDGHFSCYSAKYTAAMISARKGAEMREIHTNLTHAFITTKEIYSQFRDEVAMMERLELWMYRAFLNIKDF